MITVENLSFTYRKSKRAVLHDFSLSFESGRVYGLLGKNGAGKSTLLYLMSGLLTPKNGKVVFHDTDVRRRLPVTLQDMFLVPEEFELPSVSLVSYVELNSPFYPRFSKEEMIKYLHYFEMDIDKEEIGITVAYDDVEGWINAIHRIADHPEEAQKMGANARKLAEKRFNLEIFSREIAESLLEISKMSPKKRTFA